MGDRDLSVSRGESHPEVEDAADAPAFALPGQTFGPELDFHFSFDTPGVSSVPPG